MALRTPLSVTPHLYMGDSTGRPLDKGVVYFGEQDKDPEFYPINLFSDDALTKPLAQPVHTKGGYLYDKGDMVEPHAEEFIYSVKVLDSYGRKVFYKGAMMRNSWNDDVIEQINQAIVDSADAARQVAIDITNDAINNTAVEGGVLADAFLTVDSTINQRQVNRGFESIDELLSIVNPKDGLRVYVKSYHPGLGKGGGEFVFDESKSTINNEGTIINGWVRQTDVFSVQDFGAKADGVSDDSISIRKAIEAMPRENSVLLFPAGVYIQGDGSNPHYTPNSSGHYSGSIGIGEPIYFFFENFINFRVEGYGAVIKAHPDNSCIANNRGFEFKNCKNGVISGLTYDGQIESRKPWGADALSYNEQSAFTVYGSSYLTFTDVTSEGSVMDGFLIRGLGRTYDSYANHITLNNCKAYRSYRQGMSVVNGHYGTCVNCVFSETGTIYGTSPKFGVDLEQGYSLNYERRGQSNWLFDNCLFEDNEGAGLGLHWGSHNCTVTTSKFINNGIFCPEDSDYLTVDNNIINNYFENSYSTLIGGGVLLKDNMFVDSMFTVGSSKKTYELGVSRINKVINNTFHWLWDVTPETEINGDMVKEQRRISVGSSEVDFIDNLLVNPSGRFIIYCVAGEINKYIGNTIKSNIDPKPYATYLGDLDTLKARHSENNYVKGEYKIYSETRQITYSNSNIAKINTYETLHRFNNSGNDRFDVEICPWGMINTVKNVELTTNGNNSELFTYIGGPVSSQEKLRQKLYGSNSLIFKYSSIYEKNGKAVITVYPVGSNSIFLEVKVLATVSIDPERMGLNIVKYKVDNPADENIVFKQRLMEGSFTVLPTEDDYIINAGDSIFYNNRPIWYTNSKVWVDATGQVIE